MKTFKLLVIYSLSLLFISPVLYSQSNDYAKVKINLSYDEEVQDLQGLSLDIDHFEFTEDKAIQFIINHDDLMILEQAGFAYEVLIPDMRANYKQKMKADQQILPTITRGPQTAEHFGYGSMGGFYTLEEMEAKMDEMNEEFPAIATAKFSIGKSIDGRDIWAIKISDNPNVDEEESVVYYDALHHAREPLSMATSINYAFWLLENYETNPQVKYIIDNREIYLVPCVNPDGYEYNQQTDPDGGGLWRKNRRMNDATCFGVDLNRNYSRGYAHDSNCSSTNICSNTYRGTEAFSEPEAQAVRDFMALIQPKTAFSIHSTAGSYLMPYGFDTSPPDFSIYSEWASDFLSENDYPYGVTYQMLGYTSCGTTRDYMYSEGIYGGTPEIDGSGFWPAQSEIFDLVDENIYPLFYLAWIAGQYTDVQSHEIVGDLVPGETFRMAVEVKNKGVGAAISEVSVELLADDPLISISGTEQLGIVAARSRATSPYFTITADPLFDASQLALHIIVSQDGTAVDTQTVLIPLGAKDILFEDNAENGANNWTSSGNGIPWGINIDDSYDGTFSFGDSNGGNSENRTANYFALNESIDLSNLDSPWLEFHAKWSLEDGDEVALQYTPDEGINWINIKTFLFSESWHQELIDLSPYASATPTSFRFFMSTDNRLPADGFYFDKFSISDYLCCPTSTEDLQAHNFSLHPNPFSHYLRVITTDVVDLQIEVFDISGHRLQSLAVNASMEMDMKGLPPGTYFVKATDIHSGEFVVERLVKVLR